MTRTIQPGDLAFFCSIAGSGSLSAAARELGITTPAVSKHLAQMEARLGVTLVNRTTRRMSLTSEGEAYRDNARRILGQIDGMEALLGLSRDLPKGLLRVNATLGFGRSHVAPVISRFVRDHPQVEVQLQLSVNPPVLTEDAFDVCIRFGAPPDSRVIAKCIAPNRRLLCASPRYLAEHGVPSSPADLAHHNCIGIRQGKEAYGVWRFASGKGRRLRNEAVKVRGNLATNDGEIAVKWALDGHGILLRAEWDIERYLRDGRLVEVMGAYALPDADVYAVYPQRHQPTTRVRTFVDFIARSFERDMRR